MSIKSSSVKFLVRLTVLTICLAGAYWVLLPYLPQIPDITQALIIFISLYVITAGAFIFQLFAFEKFSGYAIHVILLTLVARMVVFLGLNFVIIYFFKDTAISGIILFFSIYLLYTLLELIALLKHTNWFKKTPSAHS